MSYNIREMWNVTKSRHSSLFGSAAAALPFMTEYSDNFSEIDRTFARTKGFFSPLWNSEDIGTDNIDDVISDFQADVFALLKTRENNFQRLYDASKLKYEPIENYRMIEEGKDTNTKDLTQTNQYGDVVTNVQNGSQTNSTNEGEQTINRTVGAQSNEYSDSAQTITTENGEKSTTENIGAVDNMDSIGSKTDTTTNKTAGYNVSEFADSDQTLTNSGNQENAHTENARTNTTQDSAFTDTQNLGAKTRSENLGQKEDTENYGSKTTTQNVGEKTDVSTVTHGQDSTSNTGTDENDHMLTRSGNIGVTTSQQMLESEVNLWDMFNFYQKIFDCIVIELLHFDDDGYDAFLTPGINSLF